MRIALGIIDQGSDGLTEGWTDRWMVGQTDGWIYRQSDNFDYVDRGGSEMENDLDVGISHVLNNNNNNNNNNNGINVLVDCSHRLRKVKAFSCSSFLYISDTEEPQNSGPKRD